MTRAQLGPCTPTALTGGDIRLDPPPGRVRPDGGARFGQFSLRRSLRMHGAENRSLENTSGSSVLLRIEGATPRAETAKRVQEADAAICLAAAGRSGISVTGQESNRSLEGRVTISISRAGLAPPDPSRSTRIRRAWRARPPASFRLRRPTTIAGVSL